MTTSSSSNYDRTALQIVTEALELIGSYAAGETITAEDTQTCLQTLNMMIKAWQAEGIGLWKNVDAILYLEENEWLYSIGSTGDHCTKVSDAVKTEIATAAALGAGTITVDSATGIATGDYIGIELDDGSLQWTTVNGAPVGAVITLTAVLTAAAAVDNHVYAYTTKLDRPLSITDVRIRDGSDRERPIPVRARQQYMALPNKEEIGSINLVYYDPQTTNGKLYTWLACEDVQEYLKFTARIPIEDFDATTNTPDLPQEWLLPLSWNLALLIAPKFGKELTQKFELKALGLKQVVSDFDREDNSVFISIANR